MQGAQSEQLLLGCAALRHELTIPLVQVQPAMVGMNPTARLPSSHTCFRQLVRAAASLLLTASAQRAEQQLIMLWQDLPVYGSKAVLREKLLAAIACEDYGMA